MQYSQKGTSHFSTIWLNEPVGVFQFYFQLWEAERLFFNILPLFVVLYLKIVENIDQTHESTFPS